MLIAVNSKELCIYHAFKLKQLSSLNYEHSICISTPKYCLDSYNKNKK